MLVPSGLECWDLLLGRRSSESALQWESSQAADFSRASSCDVLEHMFLRLGLQAMKKADAEEAPAMKSMKARSFFGADRLGSCRVVASLLRSLGWHLHICACELLTWSQKLVCFRRYVNISGCIRRRGRGKFRLMRCDAVHVSSLESWEGDEGHESDEGPLQNLPLLQCMRLSQTPEN